MMNNFSHQRIQQGFRTIILGFCLLIVELLFLPIYSYLEKMRTGGTNINRNCLEYATIQPMPLVFAITGIIILFGVLFLISGLKTK